jgi:hypothetical protein
MSPLDAAIYFAPATLALFYRRSVLPQVLLVNFLAGWMVSGWLIAMVMLFVSVRRTQPGYRPYRIVGSRGADLFAS